MSSASVSDLYDKATAESQPSQLKAVEPSEPVQPDEPQADESQDAAESDEDVAAESTEQESGAEEAQDRKPNRVPLGELLEERKKRQELERRVAELTGQTQVYERFSREKPEQAEESLEDQFYKSPVEYLDKKGQEILRQEYMHRANMSEFYARRFHEDYDQAFEGFQEYSQHNPAVLQQLWNHPAPAEYAYAEGKRFLEAKEYGGSVDGLKDKLRKEIREEVLKEMKQSGAKAAASQVTKSNADARGIADAKAPKWQGPPSVDDLYKKRR